MPDQGMAARGPFDLANGSFRMQTVDTRLVPDGKASRLITPVLEHSPDYLHDSLGEDCELSAGRWETSRRDEWGDQSRGAAYQIGYPDPYRPYI